MTVHPLQERALRHPILAALLAATEAVLPEKAEEMRRSAEETEPPPELEQMLDALDLELAKLMAGDRRLLEDALLSLAGARHSLLRAAWTTNRERDAVIKRLQERLGVTVRTTRIR